MNSAIARAFVSPGTLLAILLWLLNDLYLKKEHAGWISGKLGDAASLYVVPLCVAFVVVMLLRAGGRSRGFRAERLVYLIGAVAVGILFAAINLDQGLNDRFTYFFWGPRALRGTADVTDLLALGALVPGYYSIRPASPSARIRFRRARIVAGYCMVLLCAAAGWNTSCVECGAVRQDDGTRLLFFFASGSHLLDHVSPAEGARITNNTTANFRWEFRTYSGGTDPALLNDSNNCAASTYAGGTFRTYRLQVSAAADFQNVLLSVETTETSVDQLINLGAGTYFWRVQMLYTNASHCSEAEAPKHFDLPSSFTVIP